MNIYSRALTAGLFFTGLCSYALADTVVVTPEQQTVIREYVKKKPLASIDLPGINLSIGNPLPETVEVHKLEVPDAKYDYVVIGGHTVLVDPDTRKIVYTMD